MADSTFLGTQYFWPTDHDIDWRDPVNQAAFSGTEVTNFLGGDVLNAGSGASPISLRVREGVSRFLISDINNPAASTFAESNVPVMFDMFSYFDPSDNPSAPAQSNITTKNFNHLPGGSNVLYMDGHVEFKRYMKGDTADLNTSWADNNTGFPMTPMVCWLNSKGSFAGQDIYW